MIFCFAILKCKVVFQQQQVSQAVSWQRNKNSKIVGIDILYILQKPSIWNRQTWKLLFLKVGNKIDFDSCN